MTEIQPSDEQLLAWLDEMLPPDEMAGVEKALRTNAGLRDRTAELAGRRDRGEHSVGEIWRRRRLSCPSRSDLGAHVLGTLDPQMGAYIEFHIDEIGCRYCAANLADLKDAAAAADSDKGDTDRRRKFFQSSAGYLSGDS